MIDSPTQCDTCGTPLVFFLRCRACSEARLWEQLKQMGKQTKGETS